MKIEIDIKAEISKDKKHVLAYDNEAFNKIVGTSAGAGNPHVYKAKKEEGVWIIPLEKVKQREEEITRKIIDLQEKVIFIRTIIKKAR